MRTLGIIGFGKMGETLAKGLAAHPDWRDLTIHATAARAASRERISALGFTPAASNAELAAQCECLVIATQPAHVAQVLKDIAGHVRPDACVLSIAASITTAMLERGLGEAPIPRVIRAMTNTPCLVGAGMTVLAPGQYATAADLALAEALFGSLGRVMVLDEKHLDAVTGLSGSGPAFIFLIIEALAEAGIKLGLRRDVATILVAQTALGAARMVLDSGAHPALLRDSVTTPAGCTIDGLVELEDGRVRTALMRAVTRAAERAASLSQD